MHQTQVAQTPDFDHVEMECHVLLSISALLLLIPAATSCIFGTVPIVSTQAVNMVLRLLVDKFQA